MSTALVEAADSMAKASTHEKVGHTGQGLWKHKGWQLPAYIQHVANDLKAKVGESRAVQMAIGIVKNWAAGHDGKGHKVSPTTQAAAQKAIAEWESLKARAGGGKTKKVVESATATPPAITEADLAEMAEHAQRRLTLLEASGLPTTGPGSQFDLLLVEAVLFTEALHPRGGKGTATGGQFVAKGSSGTDVRGVQRRVGARVDGKFGNRTRAAVIAYQRKHGLTVDGVVGRQTVASLRGRRDAKRVKVGALSKADRAFLAGHVRGQGRRAKDRTASGAPIVEAVAVGSFLDRVKDLHPGEHARMPDGGAVKHHATEDGRSVWTAGTPRTWASDGMSWGQQRPTPEEAVADAFTNSAASSDPGSLGGTTRYSRYSPVTVNGNGAEFHGVDHNGQPLVRIGRGDVQTTSWPSLSPAPRLVEAGFSAPLHPRDRRGRWEKKLGSDLKAGDVVRLPTHGPDGESRGHRHFEITKVQRDKIGVQLTVKNPDGQGTEHKTVSPGEHHDVKAKDTGPVKDSPAGSGKSFAEGVSAAYNSNAGNARAASGLDSYKVSGAGSTTHKGTDPSGAGVRLRKESSGAWVVEKQDASGRWLPNRFNRDEAGRKAAESHFLAQVKGGNAGAAREQAGRMGLSDANVARDATDAEHASAMRRLEGLKSGATTSVVGLRIKRTSSGFEVNGRPMSGSQAVAAIIAARKRNARG